MEENPVAEPASLSALIGCGRNDMVPGDVVGLGESLEYFQDVSQFGSQLPGGCPFGLRGLFGELCEQGCLVTSLVKDADDGVLPGRADDLWDTVADQLVVENLHDVDATVMPALDNEQMTVIQDIADPYRAPGG